MSFLQTIKAKIGNDTYSRLEMAAEKEVALAKQMLLRDAHYQENYYKPRFLLGDFIADCEYFQKVGLKILPIEVVNILFRCKLLFAAGDEREYAQRAGGVFPLGDPALVVRWSERGGGIGAVIDRHISQLEDGIRDRTLVTSIQAFNTISGGVGPQEFFDRLFAALGHPFASYFEGDHLLEKHRQLEAGLPAYDLAIAKRFFSAPSFGFTTSGSREYCFWYSVAWLRTFLNLLRIANYIYPGQRDFGWDVQMRAPVFPVFLREQSTGMHKYDEDRNESWAKIPDGCLFLSFGYRGLSNVWLDLRTFPRIEKFMLEHKEIFDCLKSPWDAKSINDVAPTLDILSSATQFPDLGAKILLIYCCLEHLFVPKNAYTENKKYIIGGMNALGPNLIPWFDRLYDLRCGYAHKGFVLRDDRTMALVADSMKNVMTLLIAKLSVS
jgi:hypothetical protein